MLDELLSLKERALTVSQLHAAILLLLPVVDPLGAVLDKLLAQLGPLLEQLLRGARHPDAVLALELRVVLLEVLANLLLALVGQQRWRARPPQEQHEVLQVDALQYPALERPQVVAVVLLDLG